MSNITIYQGSILDCDVDAIVSPSNSFLRSTVGSNGGLAGVIERAASAPMPNALGGFDIELPAQFVQDCGKLPLIATGDAKLTSAGSLTQFKGIIHAVGPIWGGGDIYEGDLLSLAYSSAIDRAAEAGFESIAMPAISAGIFGVPIDVVAREAIYTTYCREVNVTFALMGEDHVSAFEYWHDKLRTI